MKPIFVTITALILFGCYHEPPPSIENNLCDVSLASSEINYLIGFDNIIDKYNWDKTASIWSLKSTDYINRNENGDISELLTFFHDELQIHEQTYAPILREETFDEKGLLLEKIEHHESASSTPFKIKYEYDDYVNGNAQIVTRHSNWIDESEWRIEKISHFTYNDFNKMQTEDFTYFVSAGSGSVRLYYKYDNEKQLKFIEHYSKLEDGTYRLTTIEEHWHCNGKLKQIINRHVEEGDITNISKNVFL